MAREPSYPEEAAVGDAAAPGGHEGGGLSEAAREAAAAKRAFPSKRNRHLVTGAAIGIGSAAIVAALLYANRRRDERG